MRTNGPSLEISNYIDDKIAKSDVNEKVLSYLFNDLLYEYDWNLIICKMFNTL